MRDDAMTVLAGRRVPRLGFGLARQSIGAVVDDAAATRLIDLALDRGLRYLDTAHAYTTRDHESHGEALVARALAGRGDADDVLLATKGGHHRDGDQWLIDASPDTLRRNCEASLRWLGRDHIDLYYVHFPDPDVPFEESVGALADLKSEGLIGAVGVCNVDEGQLSRAQGVTEIAAVQNRYSPFDTASDGIAVRCGELGIPFVAYSPLGGSRRTVGIEELSPTATSIARATGVTTAGVLLAWVLGRTDGMLALTGAGRPESLASSIEALEVALTTEQSAAIGREAAELA